MTVRDTKTGDNDSDSTQQPRPPVVLSAATHLSPYPHSLAQIDVTSKSEELRVDRCGSGFEANRRRRRRRLAIERLMQAFTIINRIGPHRSFIMIACRSDRLESRF